MWGLWGLWEVWGLWEDKEESGHNLRMMEEKEKGRELYGTYNQVLSGLVKIITDPDD